MKALGQRVPGQGTGSPCAPGICAAVIGDTLRLFASWDP
jgi:hypothetical protein